MRKRRKHAGRQKRRGGAAAIRFEELEMRRLLSLTHLYTFNDGTANDSIGNAHGTLKNGATIVEGWLTLQNTSGTSSNLLSSTVLSNSTAAQHAQLPAGLLAASGSATIEVWYTSSSAMANWERIFDFGDQVNGSGNSYLFFTPRSASSDARTGLKPPGGSERTATFSGGTFDGRSHMAAVVVDAAAGLLRLYIDGTLATSTALSGAGLANVGSSLAFLGRSLFDADPAYTGAIDELRIYNDAQSATQIAAQYASGAVQPSPTLSARQIENLDRGVVAFNRSSNQVYLSWRLLATDPTDIAFNVYRSTSGGAAVKRNSTPITKTTDYTDTSVTQTAANEYFVRAVINGVEQADSRHFTIAANTPVRQYLNIPLQAPAGGHLPGTTDTVEHDYTYSANDISVGDVDGDGQYEIILKWDPTDAKDNSQDGYTGNVYVDAYRLDGTRLWRIDLGKNIRAGAHYTQFQVYDLDGDGKAEVAMKTAPGTIDGLGNPVLMGSDVVTADYRNSEGYILTGSEYLTVFNGLTGANMATVAYQPARGSVTQWGDSYGNRVDRFTATIAYVDGQRPSLIMGRGYYGPQGGGQARNEIAAYDFRGGSLTLRWHFKAGWNINNNINSSYIGQGPHGIAVADVDNDGKDEIMYGAMAVNDNGTGLYSTGWGHGDAFTVSDLDQTRAGQEYFMVHEAPNGSHPYASTTRNANTGAAILTTPATQDSEGAWPDVGRGNAFDIDPRYPGSETWNTHNGSIYNITSRTAIYAKGNIHMNFAVQWDADPLFETLDGTTISNWAISNGGGSRSNYVSAPSGLSSNNGSKATPGLAADLFGDWRDEVIWRTSDNTALQIWSTVITATSRMITPMQDLQYRESIAWQNSAYNQPAHTSFYMGDGMRTPPTPNLYFPGGPSNITLSGASVPENLGAGTTIGNLAAATTGTSNAFTYAFVTGAGSADNGLFQIVGSQLRTGVMFDYEARSSYAVRVRVTDGAGKFYDKQLSITVTNVNEAPTVFLPASASPSPAGASTILSVLGADADAAGEAGLTYTWSLTGTPPAPVAYSVNGNHAAATTTATFTRAGTYNFLVTIRDSGAMTATSSVAVTVQSAIAGRSVFYGGSAFDGATHVGAIAPDKTALLPGQTAAYGNYTNYSRGLNGVIVDIQRAGGNLTAEDFEFRVGNDNVPSNWAAAPAPISVVNRAGAGASGSARVEITWADNAIVNQWLEVRVKGGIGSTSGLAADDVFYFGNTPGEMGNSAAAARVDAVDQLAIRFAATPAAGLTHWADLNRDGLIDAQDEAVARGNTTYFMNELRLITPPSPAGGAGFAMLPPVTPMGPTAPLAQLPAAQPLVVTPAAEWKWTAFWEPALLSGKGRRMAAKNVLVQVRRPGASFEAIRIIPLQ
jgi:rhamnogalacturonan endolyase